MNYLDFDKLNAEHPLTDENLAFFDRYFKPIEEVVELVPSRQLPNHVSIEDDEYWASQKDWSVRVMEESKKQTGHF